MFVSAKYNASPPTVADGMDVQLQSDSQGRLLTTGSGGTTDTLIGAVNETAPATDTASSGLNGRLQRIAQRVTSLIALIPAALGQGTMAQSLRVVLASDQSAVAVTPSAAVASTGTITSVNDTNADTTLLAANANRKGASFYNDSTVILYLAAANVTSSATVYTAQLQPGGYYELPPLKDGSIYTGVVKGIWASDASGAVRVTEWTA